MSRPWFCSALRGVPARRTFGIWWGRDQGRDRHSDEDYGPGTSHGRLPDMSRQGNKLDEALERRRRGQRPQTGRPCGDLLDVGRRASGRLAQSRWLCRPANRKAVLGLVFSWHSLRRQRWSPQIEPGALCPEFDPSPYQSESGAAVLVLVVPQIEAQTQLQLGPQLGPYEPQQVM